MTAWPGQRTQLCNAAESTLLGLIKIAVVLFRCFGVGLLSINSFVNRLHLLGHASESTLRRVSAECRLKEQFADSSDPNSAMLSASMDALDACATMSSRALETEQVREGLLAGTDHAS